MVTWQSVTLLLLAIVCVLHCIGTTIEFNCSATPFNIIEYHTYLNLGMSFVFCEGEENSQTNMLPIFS